MGMNFPDVPTNGQVSGPYTWDGEKWVVTPPSSPLLDQAAGDARFVNVSGDTMTGDLTIVTSMSAFNGTFSNNVNAKDIGATGKVTTGSTGTTGTYYFGNSGTKSLSYDGTAFTLAGGPLNMTGGQLYVQNGNVVASGDIYSGYSAATARFYFGGNTKYLNYDGTNFNLAGGNLVIGPLQFGGNAASGFYNDASNIAIRTIGNNNIYLQNAGGTQNFCILNNTSATFSGSITAASGNITSNGNFIGGGVNVILAPTGAGAVFLRPNGFGSGTGQTVIDSSGNCAHTGNLAIGSGPSALLSNNAGGASINLQTTSMHQIGYGIQTRNGYTSPGGYGGNCFNLYWTSQMFLFVDNINLGSFAYLSDYRIKKDVIDLPGMWNTVKALRPIKYTQATFSPPVHQEHMAEMQKFGATTKDDVSPIIQPGELFVEDDIERWGFLAHELQETLTPSASSGVKDDPGAIQSPNPFTLIAALTKALQEAMARIEALEAA